MWPRVSMTGNFRVPKPVNEPPLDYAPGSAEAKAVTARIAELSEQVWQLPHVIAGQRVMSDITTPVVPPHDHQRVIAQLSTATQALVTDAIEAALAVRERWAATPWWDRAAIFLRAADLAAGKYRTELVSTTMLGQSKTFHQAEIDASCETADFFRYNAYNAQRIYTDQPQALQGETSYVDQRPLEGFVLAMTPFNFTAIASNLPTTAALMGNVVVWKPSEKSAYSNAVLIDLLEEAGLPPGVINLVHGSGQLVSDVAMAHRDFAGLSFTGSARVFRDLWQKAGNAIHAQRAFPRLVGETGGKNAVVVHPSADATAVRVALIRGAFEYQGQKCSAASRAYLPRTLWEQLKDELVTITESLTVGDVARHETFLGAVIDQAALQRLQRVIEEAQASDTHQVLAGGSVDDTTGWFVRPTILQTTDPHATSLRDEFFGPLLTVYVYDDDEWAQTLELVDSATDYALTLAIFARDQLAIAQALDRLRYAAGMTYINDKPTGALMGQVSFGGARASGTNDKTGSRLALQRWISGRFIRENYSPALDWRYPYLRE
ncbi:MAG TPA: L-glutamate gamma-semialdehyde dehydrogenase [Enteractinococcus helveticum]|uniref:L-glutamate gamma-semialdehyde dehydrogenase n=1 Tax=Enteractinococcus helveticum TaxID=1837282 RepID=A0A921K713_9MICC|nr:L-glutamate gamma-semialdehyde dehydrogenase [Enteractinococcus helveticum]HJF14048.1 L-glutamate gamma-semialdehyde dehydrogenase [Enteractinococcus helveticum]